MWRLHSNAWTLLRQILRACSGRCWPLKCWFLPRDASQSAVMLREAARPSVRLSARLFVCDIQVLWSHALGWNSWKIISQPPNSLRFCSTVTQRGWSGATGTPPKLGLNRGAVTLMFKGYLKRFLNVLVHIEWTRKEHPIPPHICHMIFCKLK